jgi:Bacterial capsule synthesis protein PGA_cap
MRIAVAGDLAPIGRNESLFAEGAVPGREALAPGADLFVANLECPLVDNAEPIVKGGPGLCARSETSRGVKALGLDAVGLSNNHILDYGGQGLFETVLALSKASILSFGAGSSIEQAAKPLSFKARQQEVLIFAFADKEYSFAGLDSPGAAPLELPHMVRQLRSASPSAFKLVLLHTGNEHFAFPSPALRDLARLLVELGAGAVICQHSHCIGSYEAYRGGLIVYGQGNFIFDYPSRRRTWEEGLIVELEVEDSVLKGYSFRPVRQHPGSSVVQEIVGPGADEIFSAFDARSKLLQNDREWHQAWNTFCLTEQRNYQTLLFGLGKWSHRFNKTFGICDLVSSAGRRNIGNALRCGAHLEVLRNLYSRERTCTTTRRS